MKKRLISILLVVALCFAMAPFALAAYSYNPAPSSGTAFWNALLTLVGDRFGADLSLNTWDFTFTAHGLVTDTQLDAQKANYNSFISRLTRSIGNLAGYKRPFSTAVKAFDSENGIWRLADSATGNWIVDSMGRFPYFEAVVAGGGQGVMELDPGTNPAPELNRLQGNQWISREQVAANIINSNPAYSYDELSAHADTLNGMASTSKSFDFAVTRFGDGPYYGLTRAPKNDGLIVWLADKYGHPYLTTRQKFELAINQDFKYNSVTANNGAAVGIVGDDNQVQLGYDASTNILYIPTNVDSSSNTYDLSQQYVYEIDYDADNRRYEFKTYNNTYNSDNRRYETVTNNYYITYNITNTYIQYIGSSAEFTPTEYKLYYELPDGRSSADLTADEVAALSFQFYDCLNYERSATDVNMRALYHFDGDLSDSSYFSDVSSFTWAEGGSVTYMDSSTFDGALYLDERAHKFTMKLPSRIASGDDFTIQFRHYQASQPDTLSNVENSLSLGTTKLISWDERNLYSGSSTGNAVCQLPIGNWSELAMIRNKGVIYLYVNGVKVGSFANNSAFARELTFTLGNTSRAYTMLDELRVVDFALSQGGANYTPTSVPYDSNLVLVLPGEGETATEWFEFSDPNQPISNADFTTEDFSLGDSLNAGSVGKWVFNASSSYAPSAVYQEDGFLSLYNGRSNSNIYIDAYGGYPLAQGFYCITADSSNGSRSAVSGFSGCFSNNPGTSSSLLYSLNVVLKDGTLCTMAFNPYASTASKSFSWGQLIYRFSSSSAGRTSGLFIVPSPGQTVDIVYAGLVLSSDPFNGWNYTKQSGTVADGSLQPNTAAVQTDIPITGYTVGGVRPTFPQKGNVWFGVTSGRVSSVQVYTGSAWESANARWWTGSRWIPIYAFDIFTLEDCWDVADADDVITPIETETQGWNWWKGAWYEFREWFKEALPGLGGTPDPEPTPSPVPVTSTFTLLASEQDTHPVVQAHRGNLSGVDAKMGTSDYFTVHYSSRSCFTSHEASWPDGYSVGEGMTSGTRFNFGGGIGSDTSSSDSGIRNSIEFSTYNPATVKVWWTYESGERYLELLNAGGGVVAEDGPTPVSSGSVISTFNVDSAGTYYLGTPENIVYIYKVEVVEAGPHPVSAPNLNDPGQQVLSSHVLLSSRQITNATLNARIAELVDSGSKADLQYNFKSGNGYVNWGNGVRAQMGTGNYFTVHYSVTAKADFSAAKEWPDGFSTGEDYARFNFGGSVLNNFDNSIEFTTTGPAVVKVWWVPGGDNRQLVIKNISGVELGKTTANDAHKNVPVLSVFDLSTPDVNFLGSAANNSYIYKVEVIEAVYRKSAPTVGTNPGDNYDDGEPDILDDPLQDEDGQDVSIISLLSSMGKGMWSFVKGLFGLFGGVSGFFRDVKGNMSGFFDSFDDVFSFYTYEGEDLWD